MITSLIMALIYLVIFGALLWGAIWIVETFVCPVPEIVKKAIGVIALLCACLYLLRAFGVA